MAQVTACRGCLVENLTMYRITNSPYEEIYEKLTNAKVGKVYPDTFCYICVSVLRKFRKFATLAQHSNIKLKQWYKSEIDCKPTTQPLFTISTTTVEYVSMSNDNEEKVQIKQENIDDTAYEQTNEMQYIESTHESDTYVPPEEVNMDDSHIKGSDSWSDDQKPRAASDEDFEVPIVKSEPKKRAIKTEKSPRGVPVNKKFRFDADKSDHSYIKNTMQEQEKPQKKVFSCDVCKKEYKFEGTLKIHARCHNEADWFHCDYCEEKFLFRRTLIQHNRTKHNSPIICKHCFFAAANLNDLFSHIMDCHTNPWKKYECDLCGHNASVKKSLEIHIKKVHLTKPSLDIKKTYVCDECGYKTHLRSMFNRHSLKHKAKVEKDKPICDYCGKSFTKKFSLIAHMRVHTGERPYACTFCDQKFTQISSRNAHVKLIHKKQKRITDYKSTVIKGSGQQNVGLIHIREKPFACGQCDFKCAEKTGLTRHCARVHGKEKTYLCHMCNYRSNVIEYLSRHMKLHEDKRKENYKHVCEICDKKFLRSNTLIEHVRTHTGEKPLACPTCDQRFSHKSALLSHIKFVHEKHERKKVQDLVEPGFQGNNVGLINRREKPFVCSQCDFRCAEKGGLVKHCKRIHTKEKAYLCHMCDYRSSVKEYLNNHMKIHEPKTAENYKYVCNVCDKKFTRQHTLTEHVRTHTGEKPLACPTCDQRFAHKCSLYSHIRHVHEKKERKKVDKSLAKLQCNVKQFACDKCDFQCADKRGLTRHNFRMHIQVKRFSCNQCAYKCFYSYDLAKHSRKHEDKNERVDYKFNCQLCSKKFTRKLFLENHLKNHTCDKRHYCPECGQKYTTLKSLKRHYKLHLVGKKTKVVKAKVKKTKAVQSFEYW